MEEDTKVQVCRLCFKLISDKSFSSIKDSIKDMLQVITTDLDLDLTSSPVMCLECSELLQEIFDFKTNFFEAEEKIDSKIADVKHKKLNLRDIMNDGVNERPKRKSTGAKFKNNEICRTCLETAERNTSIPLNKNTDICLSSMLDSCFPELDLNITSDPVMCQTCYKNLQKMRGFTATCERNESHIKAYMKETCPSSPEKVNLHSVLLFLSNSRTMSEIPRGTEVKTESCEENEKVKSEENVDLGNERDVVKDYPEYVMVERKLKEETVTQQRNKELCEGENRLEYVNVKMESTDDEKKLNTAEQDPTKLEDKDKLNSHRSQSTRESSKQNNKYKRRRYHAVSRDCEYSNSRNKIYQCDECDFGTNKNIDFTKHKMLAHIKPDALQCPRCPFSTYQKSNLITHVLAHVNAEYGQV